MKKESLNNITPLECEHPVIIINRNYDTLIMQGYTQLFNGNKNKLFSARVSTKKFLYDLLGIRFVDDFGNEYSNLEYQSNKDCIYRVYRFDYLTYLKFYLYNSTIDDYQPLFSIVRCNHCGTCRKSKVESYKRRLMLESCEYTTPPYFITLTFNEKSYQKDKVYDRDYITSTIQKFHKRLRKRLNSLGYKTDYKYFFVNEYGSQYHRLHYHGLICGLDKELSKCVPNVFADQKKFPYIMYITALIRSCWTLGFSTCYSAKDSTGRYAMKYVGKNSGNECCYNWHSINLGKNEILRHLDEIRKFPHLNKFVIRIPNFNDDKTSTLYSFPIDRYFINTCYPSFKTSLNKQYRDLITECYFTMKKIDNDTPISRIGTDYVVLKTKFLEIYKIPIKLLQLDDYKESYLLNLSTCKKSERFAWFEDCFNMLEDLTKAYDYDFDKISYLNDLYEKHLAFTNMSTFDISLLKEQSRDYFANLCNSEKDNQ